MTPKAPIKRQNAGRRGLTHAVVSAVDLHVLGRTDAGVVSQRVVAGSRAADADVRRTFVDICENRSKSHQSLNIQPLERLQLSWCFKYIRKLNS